eukprot:16450782-Heterocapsa_arctica.AAC.1
MSCRYPLRRSGKSLSLCVFPHSEGGSSTVGCGACAQPSAIKSPGVNEGEDGLSSGCLLTGGRGV